MKAFHDPPTVVPATDDEVDFLEFILAHVGAEQAVAAAPVKGKFPGIAQTVSPDFVPAFLAHERIVGRNAVRQAAFHVDPQDGAEEGVDILPVADGPMLVARASAVA